jgi:hypothetical protein
MPRVGADMQLPSAAQLKRALALKEKIDKFNDELTEILGTTQESNGSPARRKRGGMSAAGRARIAKAQRARWAKVKAASKPGKRKRRKMSRAARARISAAARLRWKAAKAAGRSRL